MARRTTRPRFAISSTRRRISARPSQPKKQPRKSSRTGKSTLGRLVATGVKNIISILPGASVLSPLADFVFKSIGITQADLSSGTVTKAETSVYCTIGAFTLSLVNFMSGMKGTITDTEGTDKKIISPYRTGRLVDFTLTIRPSGVASNRAGQILVGVQPLTSEDDLSFWSGMVGQAWPQERGIKHMFMSAVGPANQPLVTRFVPKPFHGKCYLPNVVTDPLFLVVVRYENYSRPSYVDFNASDFEYSIVARGRVELYNEYPGAQGTQIGTGTEYTDSVVDLLAPASMQIHNKTTYVTLGPSGFKCESSDNGANCLVTGKRLRLDDVTLPSLASLAVSD